MDAHAGDIDKLPSSTNKRADIKNQLAALQKQQADIIDHSIRQFEKAIRLAPDYRPTYLQLASAHLLAKNTYRVRGVLQGQYVPRFGSDSAVDMLLALTIQIEGDSDQSIKHLRGLVTTLKKPNAVSSIPENVLRYSVFFNLAGIYELNGKPAQARNVWLELAQFSKEQGDALLFRLALNQVNKDKAAILTRRLQRAPDIDGKRLGDTIQLAKGADKSDLWIDGERYQIITDRGSRYVVQEKGRLISAWKIGSEVASENVRESDGKHSASGIDNKLNIGDAADRPFKTLGIPDRRLNMTSGEYLAYDDYGLAVRISNDQVKGWFLYEN
jgi:tetratricopeptide (TPR) repeat protein